MISERQLETADIEIFQEGIDNLQERYPNQSPDTWIKISVAMRSMFEKQEPRRPAVLLLLTSEEECETFPKALATMLGRCWSTNNENTNCIFDGSSFDGKDISSIYINLENMVETNHVVVFGGIEKIKNAQHLTIFHNLCDNSYATYKRICYILTVTLTPHEFEVIKQNPNQLEKQKNALLSSKWLNVSAESRAALIARVSPFTIFVADERKKQESFVKATFREGREAVAQYSSWGYSWLSYASSGVYYAYDCTFGLLFSSRRNTFHNFLVENKIKFPSSKLNKKDMWDMVGNSFENLIWNNQVYPTVLLIVLLTENNEQFINNFKLGLEAVFGTNWTVEFDREVFEIRLGSMDTKLRNTLPGSTYGHICQDVHKLSHDQLRKLISIFPRENTGTFNNTYWIFTMSNLDEVMTNANCHEIVRNNLKSSFGTLAKSGDGEYLLERMLEYTVFV